METVALDAHVKTAPCSLALEWMHAPFEGAQGQKVRDLVGAKEGDRLVFTSSGAEAVNQVLWSVFLEVTRKEGKTHFITSCLEDAPTLQMMKRLEELGCFVKIVSVNEKGEIDLEQLRSFLSPRTALVSLTMAQGLTGVVQPVEEIAQMVREKGALLHLDVSYAVGKCYFAWEADYMTFSGDLIHSVPGTGAVVAKEGRPLIPLIVGKREEVPFAMSLCAAAHHAHLFLDAMSLEVARLRDQLEHLLAPVGTHPAFANSLRLPNTTTLFFPRVHQEALVYFLKKKGLTASIGGDYSQHLYRLLMASKYPEEIAQTAVSFSLSRQTSEEEIARAAALISEEVRHLQKISEDLF